jgi:hypothetical protein
VLHAATTVARSGQGLTTAEATIIAAACTAVAVLAVGILNVSTQRKQLRKQEEQSNRQLAEQRELLERQLQAQREQATEQLQAQRDQFNRQLSEQRESQLAQRAADMATVIRDEKKATYTKVLAGCRETAAMLELMAYQHPQSLLANLDSAFASLAAERDAMRNGLAETELLGSDDAIRLVTLFTERTGELLTKFINASESSIQQSGQPALDTLSYAQAVLGDEITRSEIPPIQLEMRTTMRREILGKQAES